MVGFLFLFWYYVGNQTVINLTLGRSDWLCNLVRKEAIGQNQERDADGRRRCVGTHSQHTQQRLVLGRPRHRVDVPSWDDTRKRSRSSRYREEGGAQFDHGGPHMCAYSTRNVFRIVHITRVGGNALLE